MFQKNRDSMNKVKKILFFIKTKGKKHFPPEKYWEYRYREKGNSGSGSYGRLACFKAEIINDFIKKNKIQKCIELGCGDGNQLSLFECPSFVGLDVSKTIIAENQLRFKEDATKNFYLYNKKNIKQLQKEPYLLSLSLDVIFHLVEDSIFENYMHNLFNFSDQYVIIYSSNINLRLSPYERHRNFTAWIDQNIADWELIERIPNPFPYDKENPDETSRCDFYYYRRKQ